MIAELMNHIQSLTALMDKESLELSVQGRSVDGGAVVFAKLRVVEQLESVVRDMNQRTPDWPETMEPSDQAALRAAVEQLNASAASNAEIIQRQLELSDELISAITQEARRANGNRTTTYTAGGALARAETVTPISFDTGY